MDDQIIEIAFCDSDRHVIIDTLIYTDRPSSPGAFKVHGIYPHELIGKPTFIDIQPGHKLRLHQAEVKCLCKQFADFIGQYSPYFKANRYFSLSKAMAHFRVEHSNVHRAAADALACVTVWQGMMGSHHLATLYEPVWVNAILNPSDFALALLAVAALMVWKLPVWLVVTVCAGLGIVLPWFTAMI